MDTTTVQVLQLTKCIRYESGVVNGVNSTQWNTFNEAMKYAKRKTVLAQ